MASILDPQRQHDVIGPGTHYDTGNAGVAGDVGQRLLDNAVRGRLQLRGKASLHPIMFEVYKDEGKAPSTESPSAPSETPGRFGHPIRGLPLRANMDETDLLVVITEQGENRNPCEEQRNIFGFSCFSPGFARRCAT